MRGSARRKRRTRATTLPPPLPYFTAKSSALPTNAQRLGKQEFWQCMSDEDRDFLRQLADTKHGMGPCEYVEGWKEVKL